MLALVALLTTAASQPDVDIAERRARLRRVDAAIHQSVDEVRARRRAITASIPREGIPELTVEQHNELTRLQARERMLLDNPGVAAWTRGERPKLDGLDVDQALGLYVTLLLHHRLEVLHRFDCWSLELKTGIPEVCEAEGIFTRDVHELPLADRKLLGAVERRLRVAHYERLASEVKKAGSEWDCDEDCRTARNKRSCVRDCREGIADEKRFARENLQAAKSLLDGPIDRATLIEELSSYGMVFD